MTTAASNRRGTHNSIAAKPAITAPLITVAENDTAAKSAITFDQQLTPRSESRQERQSWRANRHPTTGVAAKTANVTGTPASGNANRGKNGNTTRAPNENRYNGSLSPRRGREHARAGGGAQRTLAKPHR